MVTDQLNKSTITLNDKCLSKCFQIKELEQSREKNLKMDFRISFKVVVLNNVVSILSQFLKFIVKI